MKSLVFSSVIVIFVIYLSNSHPALGLRHFHHGRPHRGLVPPPQVSNAEILNHLPVEQWFDQRLDHFNGASTETWKQRYFVNATFYKPGSPVFVMIGGEGAADPVWMVDGEWIRYAQKFNAMCWMLEHRFYGKSHPTNDMSTGNLRYLSSEQALADLANFILTMRDKARIPSGSKLITFGGSYPGSLSAWFRLKYPHIVYGAVATSAPILARIDFKEYLEVVDNSLRQGSDGDKCVSNIQTSMQQVQVKINTPDGRNQLKQMFKLCEPIDVSNSKDIMNLFSVITDNFNGVVQYNKDNRAFEGAVGTNITIHTLCGVMSRGSDTLANLAAVNALLMTTYNQTCLDYSYGKMISEMRQTDWNSSASEGGRQWMYQTCTEFGFFQSSDSSQQPFGHNFPVNFSVSQCGDIFGPGFTLPQLMSAVERTNQNYGGYSINVTRVMFPNGSIDPWHALGVTKDLSPTATAIYINGTAHCANMYPPRDEDSNDLNQARAEILQTLSKWLAA